MNIVAEYRDILNQSQVAALGRFSVGGELALRGKVFFRGGWGGGYPSAGLGVKAGKNELSFAWYSVEIGNGYMDQRDTRFSMQYLMKGF